MAPDLAVDAVRAIKLRVAGYEIYTATIPAAITPRTACSWGRLVWTTFSLPGSMAIRQLVLDFGNPPSMIIIHSMSFLRLKKFIISFKYLIAEHAL